MRNPGGYGQIIYWGPQHVATFDRGLSQTLVCEGITEVDSFTCKHCGTVIHVLPKMDPADLGGMCKQCMKLICPACVGGSCTPLEKRLEQEEARDRLLREYQDLSR